MKKLFSLVLVLVLALSLTACKKETKAAEYVYPQVSDSASKAFEVTINEKTLSLTKDELLKNTREILFPQIEKALTEPITAQEIKKSETSLRKYFSA